jgi:hypothetical protein
LQILIHLLAFPFEVLTDIQAGRGKLARGAHADVTRKLYVVMCARE